MNKRTKLHIETPMDDCFCKYHKKTQAIEPCIHGDLGDCPDCNCIPRCLGCPECEKPRHTPAPWDLTAYGLSAMARTTDEIKYTFSVEPNETMKIGEAKANAAFIVRAVNKVERLEKANVKLVLENRRLQACYEELLKYVKQTHRQDAKNGDHPDGKEYQEGCWGCELITKAEVK